jgi:hypothetical protein
MEFVSNDSEFERKLYKTLQSLRRKPNVHKTKEECRCGIYVYPQILEPSIALLIVYTYNNTATLHRSVKWEKVARE